MTHTDRPTDDRPDDPQPIDPPLSEDERYRLYRARAGESGVGDVGRTMGGGSLGHTAPDRVEQEAPLRNNADDRTSDEPTLPSREPSVHTKI
jgi:hypothetical protein